MAIRMIQKAACMNQSLPINSNQTGRKFINKQATSIATTTQMALKNVALVAALLMAAAVAPPAASQSIGNGNVMVSGTVPCSSVAINITLTTPVFANATVVLKCGQDIFGSTVSNSKGAFSLMIMANITTNLSALLGSCRLVVPTPLSVCNPLLALQSNGTLQAPLQLHSSSLSLGGIFGVIINLVPSIFKLVP